MDRNPTECGIGTGGVEDFVMAIAEKWLGMRYPDSDLVGLLYRFARPENEGLLAVDAGCGPGRHLKLLIEAGYRAVGIDSEPRMCRIARANGFDVEDGELTTFRPSEAVSLLIAWGFTPVCQSAAEDLAAMGAGMIIANWRSMDNDCRNWPQNRPVAENGYLLNNPGHTLDGLTYYFHELADCQFPGYQRIHWQCMTKTDQAETNQWWQTVHRLA